MNKPLYNIPPKSILQTDPATIKDAADREAPPQSFFQLQKNAIRAVQSAIRDGHTLLEIEFPPLPAKVLEMDDVSAYEVAEANINLAVDFSKGFLAEISNTAAASGADIAIDDNIIKTTNFQITILLPDEAERDIALQNLGGVVKPAPGVQIGSLRRSEEGDTRIFKVGFQCCMK